MVDHLAHSCCDTKNLRGLAHWNLPSLGFCEMRSGHYKSEVTMGKHVDSSVETQIRLINPLSHKTLGTRYAKALRQIL